VPECLRGKQPSCVIHNDLYVILSEAKNLGDASLRSA